MAPSVELLIPERSSDKALAMLHALRSVIPGVQVTNAYRGNCDWLVLFGVGAPDRDIARKRHVKSGRRVLMWDLGYFDRMRSLRCSIDHDHPQAWLDRTPPDPSRWSALGIKLREDADPQGHIVLVGLGVKSRAYLREQDWERLRLKVLRARFPGRRIIYRPKPNSPSVLLNCVTDATSPIEDLLKGAALISCRHSNVAVDAAVAGIPFECDDGAAVWLKTKPYTRENRFDFLYRLMWWQWRAAEAAQAWEFVQRVTVQEKVAA